MAFAEVVRHDLDPRDVHESLLYVRSNISVYCTAPCGSGKQQRQHIARKRVEKLVGVIASTCSYGRPEV